jgi:hypothetical protein
MPFLPRVQCSQKEVIEIKSESLKPEYKRLSLKCDAKSKFNIPVRCGCDEKLYYDGQPKQSQLIYDEETLKYLKYKYGDNFEAE